MRGAMNRHVGVHPVLIIATFLDPRFKSLGWLGSDEERQHVYDRVVELMAALETARRAEVAAQQNVNLQAPQQEAVVNMEIVGNGFMEAIQQVAGATADLPPVQNEPSPEAMCRKELDEYKNLELTPLQPIQYPDGGEMKFNDPLIWWLKHEVKFPMLAKLAKFYLAVQATSAASERVFSIASRLLSIKRNRMDPAMAGEVYYVHSKWDWFSSQVSWEEAIAAASNNNASN
jgi:zinc finger BED domain-containing protein 1 (E3 SUMO-protein ligase ZBED1)